MTFFCKKKRKISKKIKRQFTEWEKISAKYVSDVLIPKIYNKHIYVEVKQR